MPRWWTWLTCTLASSTTTGGRGSAPTTGPPSSPSTSSTTPAATGSQRWVLGTRGELAINTWELLEGRVSNMHKQVSHSKALPACFHTTRDRGAAALHLPPFPHTNSWLNCHCLIGGQFLACCFLINLHLFSTWHLPLNSTIYLTLGTILQSPRSDILR